MIVIHEIRNTYKVLVGNLTSVIFHSLLKEEVVLEINFLSAKEEAAMPIDISVLFGCFIFCEVSAT
jgi:hypothetical protein